jgi:hypothetical protein
MPKVTLSDGTVLVGPKADEYIQQQKKAEKEAKKNSQKKLIEARKSGDEETASAVAADLAAKKQSVHQSNADAFQSEIMHDINTHQRHPYTFYRISRPSDWNSDEKQVNSYIQCNLKYNLNDAPTEKDLHLYMGDADYKWYNAGMTTITVKDKVLEVHPSLLKKNGKLAIEIPDNCVVAVRGESNTAQRIAASHNYSKCQVLREVDISHSYICAIIPTEKEEEYLSHNMDETRVRKGRYDNGDY